MRDAGNSQWRLAFAENDLGVGNQLTLSDVEILENLKAIQLRNALPPSDTLDSDDFTVEMGPGKSCVYLRTILAPSVRSFRSCW